MRKVLIANRGEIACRIARTCRRLGIGAATIHSSADRSARHVREIGESIEVGGAPATESYLNIDAVLAAAQRVGADAIHPGYGFLSENAAFARAVEAAGVVFIGPDAATIERIGGKASAKREAARAGLAVIDGTDHGLSDPAAIAARIRDMPLPVLLKAVAGGGGRGMAVIERSDDIEARIESAMREAAQSFGNGELIVERYLPKVRHIEVQIAGDGHGNAIHLFERECTLQRRHQKLIEEAPAANLPAELLTAMRADACRLAAAVGYRNLGTVEFIVANGAYHFLEVNPRLQVEHPVTEEVTGLDLVELQLRIAADGRLPLTQADVRCDGHAFEARLCAEDPAQGFLPQSGRIVRWQAPAGVRVDHALAAGCTVPPFYDSMLARVIAAAPRRAAAVARLADALDATVCLGVTTNRAFLVRLLRDPEFAAGGADTAFVDRRYEAAATRSTAAPSSLEALAAASLALLPRKPLAPIWAGWSSSDRVDAVVPIAVSGATRRWRLSGTRDDLVASCDGLSHRIAHLVRRSAVADFDIAADVDGRHVRAAAFVADGIGHWHADGSDLEAIDLRLEAPTRAAAAMPGLLLAPLHGRVTEACVAAGASVAAGALLVVIEAMKMEHQIRAPHAGTVAALHVRAGDQVAARQPLVEVTP